MTTDFWMGVAVLPATLIALCAMAYIAKGLIWLVTSGAIFGTLYFGISRHGPVTAMLERAPDEYRTLVYSKGRLGVILLAERKDPRPPVDDAIDVFDLPFMDKEADR